MTKPTTEKHPVISIDGGLTRVSRTAAITQQMVADSNGVALSAAFDRVKALVDKRVGDKERAATFYYVTYEVVLDDDGGPGRPVRPPVDGTATGVVLARVLSSERKKAAA